MSEFKNGDEVLYNHCGGESTLEAMYVGVSPINNLNVIILLTGPSGVNRLLEVAAPHLKPKPKIITINGVEIEKPLESLICHHGLDKKGDRLVWVRFETEESAKKFHDVLKGE